MYTNDIGQKALEVIGEARRVCYPHDLSRCGLYMVGLAGQRKLNTSGLNDTARDRILVHRRIVAAIHHSTRVCSEPQRYLCHFFGTCDI